MPNIDKNKLANLPTTNRMPDEKDGGYGTDTRYELDELSHRELREAVIEISKIKMSHIIGRHIDKE